ncbi:MAG: type II toxin-antitoxin system RelE/ParE family toxin [Burkholderiales bacterium]|nr:type II toxin-antitoxin system RelE/ParE family toxin [Burkholderiales bacterium]
MDKRFTIRYLPLFEQDLATVCEYIARNLKNSLAALRLIEETERAILKRLENPLGFVPFRSIRDRKQAYYRINIRNYAVFYVVIGDVMEVRRFVYSKRNISDIL